MLYKNLKYLKKKGNVYSESESERYTQFLTLVTVKPDLILS